MSSAGIALSNYSFFCWSEQHWHSVSTCRRRYSPAPIRSVITVRAETPLSEIASLLDKHRIKRVPVVDNEKIIEIVSRANLVQVLQPQDIVLKAIDDSLLRNNIFAQLQSERWWPGESTSLFAMGVSKYGE